MEQIMGAVMMLSPALSLFFLVLGVVAVIGHVLFHHRRVYEAGKDMVGRQVDVVNRRSGKDRRYHHRGEGGHLAA